jgi:hypothetical protein
MFALIPAMLLAAACSGKDRSADDELKKDLALAASDGLGMAPAPRTGIISADEIGPAATPKAQTRKAPRKGTARPRQAVIEPTVAEEKATEVALEPAPTPTVIAASPSPTTTDPEPIPTPRPRPIPVEVPTGAGSGGASGDGSGTGTGDARGGGPDIGTVIGTVIGVIIRGGMAGEDHCDPRTDGRRRRGPMVGGPSPFPGTIIRGMPSIPINPMVPRMGVPVTRGGMSVNERMPERTGGRMVMPRQ